MYYRIFQLLCCLLIFCASCQQQPLNTTIKWLSPGDEASHLITSDAKEGYFETVNQADMTLQMRPIVFDTLVTVELYQKWLSGLILPWTASTKERCEKQLVKAVQAAENRFPGLLPDSIQMLLVKDEPYGAQIYFTRNNAIFIPESEAKHAESAALHEILLHELFHLISRNHPTFREDLYALANFSPAPTNLLLDSLQHLSILINPDAPNYDYVLNYENKQYLPVLFAKEEAENFDEALDYAFFEVAKLTKDSSMEVVHQVIPKRLADFKIPEATEANTSYLIHPEEILAEHFALLFLAKPESVRYPDELQDMEAILNRKSKLLNRD